MKLRRKFVLPSLFFSIGGAALVVACGDDDSNQSTSGGVITLPAGEGGVIPAKGPDAGDSGPGPNDSGSDADANNANGPTITTTTLSPVVAGTAAADVLLAATGATPITWSVTTGNLPSGMTLSADGKLSGTPNAVGDFTFTVTATNAGGSDTQELKLTVTAPAINAYALVTGNKLAGFATTFPTATTPTALTGVTAGDELVAVDVRPQNNYLYALGYNSTAKSVTLYAIEPSANLATPVGLPATFAPDLAGTTLGMDVNPAVDRIRIVTSAGQSFRMNPNTGAPVDSDIGTTGNQMDGNINGGTSTAAVDCAYTNNVPNNGNIATLYTIAATTLYIQNPPNNGVLTTPLSLTGVETVFGFDIAPGVNAATSNAAPAAGNGAAIVKMTGNAVTQFATINLVTGAPTVVAAMPFDGIVGFALAPTAPRPIIALSADGASLLRFSEAAPGTVTTQALTGVTIGETLVGIDYRPATGQLYGLGINATLDTGTLYLIDPQAGTATAVGTPTQIAFTTDGVTAVDFPAATSGWGFDFNPTVDRIRVTTGTGLNFRVNPITGSPVDGNNGGAVTSGTNPDGAISGAGTGLEDVAYTDGPAVTGAITTEYGLNVANQALHIVTVPNAGTLGTAIPIKVGGNALAFTAIGGFDIPQSVKTSAANAAVTEGSSYAVLTVSGTTGLYKINLVDGTATLLGAVGAGTTALGGLAVGH